MICLVETQYKTSKITTCVQVNASFCTFIMWVLDHVLVTDEAASGVAPITVDNNGTGLTPEMYTIPEQYSQEVMQ